MTRQMRRLFCFGLGYSAMAFARRLRNSGGWQVAGTCRSPDKVARLAGEGIDAVVFDGSTPLDAQGQALLADAEAVLCSIPPGEAGDPVLYHHGDEIAALRQLEWIGYLSTTGVYGDRDGAWVDETTPIVPRTQRARRRAEAEEGWLALAGENGLPVHIFRLAGIYGPGRTPFGALRRGEARRIVKPGQVFSRIHLEDIAAVLAASLARPSPGRIYNVCDDRPAPSAEVTAYAAELLGLPLPPAVPIEDADLSPMAASFYAECRRVGNRRIKDELGVELAYPDYKAGLAALAAQEREGT